MTLAIGQNDINIGELVRKMRGLSFILSRGTVRLLVGDASYPRMI